MTRGRWTTKDGANTLTGEVARDFQFGWWLLIDGDHAFGQRFFTKEDWTFTPEETA